MGDMIIQDEAVTLPDDGAFLPSQAEDQESLNAQDKCRKRKRRFAKADLWLAILLLIDARIYAAGFIRGFLLGNSLGFLCLFTALYLMAGTVYMLAKKRKIPRESYLYLALTALSGLWFGLFTSRQGGYLLGCQEQDIAFYVFLFLHVVGVYWLMTLMEGRMDGCLNERALRDVGRGMFVIPVSYFTGLAKLSGEAAVGVYRYLFRVKRDGDTFDNVLRGIFLGVPVLCVVLPLLSSADEGFSDFLAFFARGLIQKLYQLLWSGNLPQLILTLLIGSYLFGLFYGNAHAKTPAATDTKPLAATMLMTFLSMVLGVYLLFFLVKTAGALKAIQMADRGKLVYSSFARQGFFELCAIGAINFCIFYFVKWFSVPEIRRIKTALTLLGVQTLGFILLAFSKMSLYISVYGLTFRRVFTMWFMTVLSVTFCLLLRAVWKPFNGIRAALLFGSISFLALAYSNMTWWMEALNRLILS